MLQLNFRPFPVLTTKRITLNEIVPGDAAELYRLRSDATIRKYVDIPMPASAGDMEAFIEQLRNNVSNNEAIFWVISLTGTHAFAGTICLWNISKEQHTAEIGYMLHPEYHGKGLMQEALAEVIAYGFDTMHLEAITAYTHKDNTASIKLLERNGFKKDAVLDALIDRQEEPDIVAYKSDKL